MTAVTLARFPASVLRSQEEFQRWSRDARDVLDERYRREQELGTHAAEVTLHGACGICMEVASFCSATDGGELTPDGRMVPNWREGQVCNCHRALSARQRGLLHCLLTGMAVPNWCASAAIGPPDVVTAALADIVQDLKVWPAFQTRRGQARLPGRTASMHIVISSDYLHLVSPLEQALEDVARVLVGGGTFVFSAPFYHDRSVTLSGSETPLQFGWDILDKLSRAGFSDAAAHCFWSEELGYFGSFNMIFKAVR